MRLTTPHGISSPPFRFQGELCLWLLKKCYPCLRYTCYLCLQSIQRDVRGGTPQPYGCEFRVSGFESRFGLETRNPKPETNSHLPFHTGGRFSTNARGPSLASSVCITMLWRSDSNRSPCSKVISLPL